MDSVRTHLMAVENSRKGPLDSSSRTSAVPPETPVFQLLPLDLAEQRLDQGVLPSIVLLLLLPQHQPAVGKSSAGFPVEALSEDYLPGIGLLLYRNLWRLSTLFNSILLSLFGLGVLSWILLDMDWSPLSVSEETPKVEFVLF